MPDRIMSAQRHDGVGRWASAADEVTWDIRPFIDGEYRDSTEADGYENVNPATEASLCVAPLGSAADVDAAVRVARRRFEEGCWSEVAPAERGHVLLKLADLIAAHSDELALLDTLEMGKPIEKARIDAGKSAPAYLREWAGLADRLLGASAPVSDGTLSLNAWEPRGVVGAISPWNFPLVNAVVKLGPALAAGNTIVLKPSEISPSSALRLAELTVEAGVPPGVVNVVPGVGRTAGQALASHVDVDFLSFTGSTATGRRIMELSGASNGKPVLLECGGKSPHVVFGDVDDLDAVAEAVVASILFNQGQVCGAHSRLIVDHAVKAQLLEKVVDRAQEWRPADPLDDATSFGPMASPMQRDRVKDYVRSGIEEGAIPVLEGAIQEEGGCYVWPTVFDRVDGSARIVQEEIFGPVLCVQEFRSEDEALALANSTGYGLAATAWTRDLGRARRAAHAIRAGAVFVCTGGPQESPRSGNPLSFEPQKASGFGSEKGPRSLESYSTLKLMTFLGR